MNSREAVRRLRAYQAGKPLPCGETKRVHIVDDQDALILSFVRMGGESRPWGIAIGRPGQSPKIVTVPEARNRDLVSEMVITIAPKLLKHFRCPQYSSTEAEDWDDLIPLRQLWLPNVTYLDMLHHLAFAYAWTKSGGENRAMLNAFGRLCGWLFREAQRPGQMCVMTATEALRSAYTFPAEDARQGHLGFLMAWLKSSGNYERRLVAAMKAEQHPIATSLAPELERDELQPLVEDWGQAESDVRKNRVKAKIHTLLETELRARWELTEQAIDKLRNDRRRENTSLGLLVTESLKEQWFQYTRLELKLNSEQDGPAFFPSVETDRHPAAAASRYQVHQASAELVEGLLVHDDSELLAEAISGGDAFRGEILEVRDIGTARSTRPLWTVQDAADRQLRLRVGSRVAVVGYRERQGQILEIRELGDGTRAIDVEITARKTNQVPGPGFHARPPTEQELVGETVAFVSAPADQISRSKSQKTWNKDGPGAWLTHQVPGGVRAQVRSDDLDDAAEVDASMNRE